LPFADTFDVVFVHTVLSHIKKPFVAVQEMLRVVKPNGVIAAREVDFGMMVAYPCDLAFL